MEKDMVDRLRRMVTTAEVLEHVRLRQSTVEKLIDVTYNRGVLLGEISELVFRTVLGLNDDEVETVMGKVQILVGQLCDADKEVKGRHLPKILPRLVGQELVLAHKMIKPVNWTALDMVATGIDSQSYDVAEVVREIYDPEEKRLSWQRGQQGVYTTLRERCEVSGYEDFIPTVTESKKGIRLARGPLQKRLKAEIARDKRSVRAESAVHWRFKGHLQEQARIQVALGTIHGSWTSVVSELDGFAMFINIYYKGRPHYPLEIGVMTAFMSHMDCAASAEKYLQAVIKSSNVLLHPVVPSIQLKMLRNGVKKFEAPKEKSYLHGHKVDIMARTCLDRGRPDLARSVLVWYTYQLRVQSEGIELSTTPEADMVGTDWHSHVATEVDGAVSIRLRVRKNKRTPSVLRRYCICHVWPGKVVCGVCALKKALTEHQGYGRLFPGVKASDVSILKEVGWRHDLGPVTLHGFRRGRTEDMVKGLDSKRNPAASFMEVAESLGHNMRRAAMFNYMAGRTANLQRSARRLCEDTDSD